ncbi:MAG: phosphoenolpyruvate carboxykinase (ATP) [Chloroflexota bacterium]|nr:phosphoenolpyruvate carboxykinase (ATP) [Chloroflexota bacterium]
MSNGMDLNEFATTANRIRKKALEENRLVDNPSDEELRRITEREPGIVRTLYGNLVADSEPTSRAAMLTKNSVDHPFGEEEARLLAQCEEALGKERLICIDRIVGNAQSDTTVRMIVPERFAHLAYGGGHLFVPARNVKEPTYQMVFFTDEAFEANKSKPLPEKDITIRLAMLDDGRVIKICRNSNYIGEYKKGVFASEDWNAKMRRGGLFLHAGCREDYLQSVHGDYRNVRTLLVALSANGKTTTTCRIMAKKGRERSWLIQDDGGTLMADGSFYGFELGGVFVKTEGVNPGEQTEVFYGLLKPDTLGENVFVSAEGDFDLYDFSKTSNGRAVIRRCDFMHASPYIDVDMVDNLVLITRGPLIPAICKLTRAQAAALMVLGQAMESSAGDPTQAGRIRREFFYDPFMAGNRAQHANTFYEILRGLPHMKYYLLNTGGVGEGERHRDIKLEYTMGILDSLLRGGLEDWVDSPSGFKVPKAIRTVDETYLHPERLYGGVEFEEKQHELNRIRHDAVEEIGSGLHRNIRSAFKK